MDFFDMYDLSVPARVTEYINYAATVKNLSSGTISGYKTDLKLFFKFIKKLKTRSSTDLKLIDISDINDDFIKNITLSDIYMFFNYITVERKNGANSRARKSACLRSFFGYLETKVKILPNNPTRELENPKLDKRNPIYLTLDESKMLLEATDGLHKERDYCILTIFLNCGLRLEELRNINISNIRGDTLTVIGKGSKERVVYLTEACCSAIEDYLKVRLEPTSEEDKDALFVSSLRKRIGRRTIQDLLQKYLQKAGLTQKKYSVHKLRHTAATLLVRPYGLYRSVV